MSVAVGFCVALGLFALVAWSIGDTFTFADRLETDASLDYLRAAIAESKNERRCCR